jgi:ribonucleoside-triphosphate reductase
MKCPYCNSSNTKVVDKRITEGGNRRRRECIDCGKRFTTYEKIEISDSIDKVKKRDGKIVDFDKDKIAKTIFKAAQAVGGKDKEESERLSGLVVEKLNKDFKGKIPTVEDVSDAVEKILIEEGHAKTAKAYILYRNQHKQLRESKTTFVNVQNTIKNYIDRLDWQVKENSNEAFSFSGLLLYTAGEVMKNYNLTEMYTPEIAEAHRKGYLHIHDLSHGVIGYCAGWSLKNLLLLGFGGVPNKVDCKPAKHMNTIVHQMVNYIGCLQMEFAGAQAFSSVDTLLAPFIKADNLTYKQVKQAMQQLVFSLNIPSRWGCVTPDTEILTLNGWKRYNEIKEGEAIWSLNLKTKKIIEDKIKKINIYDFDGDLIKLSNRSQEQLLTPNHRVIRTKYNSKELVESKAEDLLNFNSPVYFPVARENTNEDFDIGDEELKLYPWIISEGTIDQGERIGRERITIFQSPKTNKEYCSEIESILNNLNIPFSPTFVESGFGKGVNRYRLGRSVSKELVKTISKTELPMSILRKCSPRQIKLFVNEYIKGDGSKERLRIYTKDEQIKDNFQELCAICGYGSRVYLNKNGIFVINIHKNQNQSITKKEKVKYKGKVWCPTTTTSTWIARRKGNVFITGNSQYPFSNLTFDWAVPEDMKDQPAIVAGKEQDFTYGDCQKELDMINKAFLEVMIEGDASGRIFSFPIPTYNLTKDFNWESENAKLLFDLTAKYGMPYFQNYVGSNLDPSSIRAMCCRLNLNQQELMNRPGGMWGPGDSTGSIGVMTINMNRIGYEAKNKAEFFEKLAYYMMLSKNALEIKRKVVERNLANGLMPFTKRYLGTFNNHFSTIGLCGMHECCVNFLGKGIETKRGKSFTIEVLKFMRDEIKRFQQETGNLFNLEATPAESTAYRLARLDKEKYPDIYCSGDKEPYLTNSTQLPVDHTDDAIEAIEHQNDIQPLYTGGTIFHTFLGERITDGESCKRLVKKIAYNTRLPYFSITPTFSICKKHGYIRGEKFKCPACGDDTEVYSRIVGYYRPVQNWNAGKVEEFKDRLEFSQEKTMKHEFKTKIEQSLEHEQKVLVET